MSSPRAQAGYALALSLAGVSVATGIAGWVGAATALGAACLAVIVLALAFGWRRSLSGAVLSSLVGIFVLFSGLISAMVALDDPTGPLSLWLGLPAPTAILVYAVWPLGVLPSLLYAFRFRDSVLPPDRLERFLADHSRHKK